MNTNASTVDKNPDANRDPITGTPGAHPVGTGVGAALGGAAAGAAAGTVAGPLGGKGVAEALDPTVEDAYWRENYEDRPYVVEGTSYDDYGPAYRYGMESFGQYPGRSFDEVESDLSRDWQNRRSTSSLEWNSAKDATRDAWQRLSDRVERATPGDSDRDGK
jgi:hypothetical protein